MMQALAEAVDCEASARNALALRPPDFARARALCQESRRHLLRFNRADSHCVVPSGEVNDALQDQDMYGAMAVQVGRDCLDRLAQLEEQVHQFGLSFAACRQQRLDRTH